MIVPPCLICRQSIYPTLDVLRQFPGTDYEKVRFWLYLHLITKHGWAPAGTLAKRMERAA